MQSYHDPSKTLQLVFSDEFETEGRSFYPGDDPYWYVGCPHFFPKLTLISCNREAVDLVCPMFPVSFKADLHKHSITGKQEIVFLVFLEL